MCMLIRQVLGVVRGVVEVGRAMARAVWRGAEVKG